MKLNYTEDHIKNFKDNVKHFRKNPNWLLPEVRLNEGWTKIILELIQDWETMYKERENAKASP